MRSNEPDVAGVVGKVAQGAVDAGFVYVTDVEATEGKLKAIDLPGGPQAAGGVRCRRGQGREASGAGAAVRRRAAGRRGQRGARRAPASCRRPGVNWFTALLWAALAVVLAFLVLPVVAIFVDVGPRRADRVAGRSGGGRRARGCRCGRRWPPWRSSSSFGTPAAWLLATRSFRGRELVITLVELPLVLPPAVAGIGLLAAVGPSGLLAPLGISFTLSTAAVVVALTFVAAPFYLRQAQSAFAALDRSWLDASRTLGAGEARTLARVAIPAALPGLSAGLALAWGRALGEFGATLMFAGSFQGVTQTVPLAIYERFATDFTGALGLSAVLVCVSGGAAARGQVRASVLRIELTTARAGLSLALEVGEGECVALAGPSGAGKTTVLQTVAGLFGPSGASSRAGRTSGSTPRRGVCVAAGAAALRLRVPGLRAVRAPERVAQRRLRNLRTASVENARMRICERFGLTAARGGQAGRALRRRTAARGARAGSGARSGGPAARRAVVRARPAHARFGHARAARRSARNAHPVTVGHARLRRGGTIRRPRRRARRGRVVQLGPPAELSARPASAFVADFTGAVVLTGVASPGPRRADAGRARRRRDDRQHRRGERAGRREPVPVGDRARGRQRAPSSAQNHLDAEVVSITEIGGRARVGLLAGQPLVAEVTVASVHASASRPGARVMATWKAAATRLTPR